MRAKLQTLLLFLCLTVGGAAAGVTVPLNQNLLSGSTYSQLSSAQRMMETGDYNGALVLLDKLESRVRGNRYEYAITELNIAYVYINQSNFNSAVSHMLGAVQEHAMPPAEQLAAVLDLAKLYARTEQYSNAQRIMSAYLKASSNPPPDAEILMANVEAKLGQCRAALPYAKRAVNRNEGAPESWYQVWIACAYSIKDYNSAITALYAALEHWPNNADYWRQLGQTYAQAGDNSRALGVFALMYRQGLAQNEQDYLNLVSLYMQHNEPYEAATVLQKGLHAAVVTANEANYNLLAATWLDAREYDKAISTLGEAAKYAKTGDAYLKQAQLYQQTHEWFSVVRATQKALQKGNLKHPGQAWLLQGVAQAENKQYPEAASALKEAAKYADARGLAETWIRYVETRAGQTF